MGKTAENMNKKRLKSFEKLSENEQGILIALAVIFIPIRQGYFQELLKDRVVSRLMLRMP